MNFTKRCLTLSSIRKNVNTNLTTLMVDEDIGRNESRRKEELNLPTKLYEDGTETTKKDEDELSNKTSSRTPATRRHSVVGQDTSQRSNRDRWRRNTGFLLTQADNAAGVANYAVPDWGAAGVAGTRMPSACRPNVVDQDESPQVNKDSQ